MTGETAIDVTVRYACAASAGLLASVAHLPDEAASAAATDSAAQTMTFDQCRDWRMHFIEARQVQIAAELAKNLIDVRCASLQRQKA